MQQAKHKPRCRPFVFIVATKWHLGSSTLRNEGPDQNVITPWEVLDWGPCEVWHPDANMLVTGCDLETDANMLVCSLQSHRPDLVVLTRCPWVQEEWWNWLRIVTRACARSSIPAATWWHDLVTDGDIALAERMAPLVYGQIQIDRHVPPTGVQYPDGYLSLWTIHDPRLFYVGVWDRPIPLVCVGDWEQPVRRRIRARLDEAQIAYTIVGGQRHAVSYAEYARSCRLGQMLINTNNHPTRAQLKGHVFEALSCGTLLLEQHHESGGTQHLLTPFLEYVPYYSDEDLVDRIRYYQRHTTQRESIAQNGARAYWERYSPAKFWTRLSQFVWGSS